MIDNTIIWGASKPCFWVPYCGDGFGSQKYKNTKIAKIPKIQKNKKRKNTKNAKIQNTINFLILFT